jgi:endonuclease/exonuclease/phosphatase family metal-dependent hydrolase
MAACGGDDGGDSSDARRFDASQIVDSAPIDYDGGNLDLPETLPDPLPTGEPDVTLVTYNTALALTIRYAEQREPLIIEELKTLDADVVCVQEVWDHFLGVPAFYAEIASEWPHVFWSWQDSKVWGNGLMILSKHPLYRGRELVYTMNDTNNVLDRMVIAADVVTDDSYFHFMCTHLHHAAEDPLIRQDEMRELNELATAEGYWEAGQNTFLLGDFNTGPSTTSTSCNPCDPHDVASYNMILDDWTDPNENWDQCTFCIDIAGPLAILGGKESQVDQRIDHCFYKGSGVTHQSSRVIYDGPLELDVPGENPDGGLINATLSDHIGVECIFAPDP